MLDVYCGSMYFIKARMKKNYRFFLLLLCFFLSKNVQSQSLGFETQRKGERIDIPFEFENNFIVVTILFQNLFPLKFIFDTGAEHTILCKKDFTEIMNIRYDKEFKILGADMKTELKAYLARGISLKVNNLHQALKYLALVHECKNYLPS